MNFRKILTIDVHASDYYVSEQCNDFNSAILFSDEIYNDVVLEYTENEKVSKINLEVIFGKWMIDSKFQWRSQIFFIMSAKELYTKVRMIWDNQAWI